MEQCFAECQWCGLQFVVKGSDGFIPKSCCSQCRRNNGLGGHSQRCWREQSQRNTSNRSIVLRQRSRSRHAVPLPPPAVPLPPPPSSGSGRCLQLQPTSIDAGYGHHLMHTEFTAAKIVLVSGGIGSPKIPGDRAQQRRNFQNVLCAASCLDKVCLTSRDVQNDIYQSDDADRRAASSRTDDAVYHSIKANPNFAKVTQECVDWIRANLYLVSIDKVVLGISCRSGKHRSTAVIRFIAESMPPQCRVVELDTAAMSTKDIDTAVAWMRPL